MTMLEDRDLMAVALTSRAVESAVKPLAPREFWAITQVLDPAELRGMTSAQLTATLGISKDKADRIARLADRAVGIAIAIERFEHAGVWTVTGVGAHYPERLRTRLGDSAPVVLCGVGDVGLLDIDGLGVVGSRNVTEEGTRVAHGVAQAAVHAGLPLISGAARGVDQAAMNAAASADGKVVGIVADALDKIAARPSTRRGVLRGQFCLVTPYSPDAPFSVGNAMGRNKIIYALSRCTVVVASEIRSGGTWSGATEALKNDYGQVLSWTGPGGGPGNAELLALGARELNDIAVLGKSITEQPVSAAKNRPGVGDQLTIGI